MWAPEIHFVNGRFMVYFSARKKSNSKLAIGVAISTDPKNPFGPYEDYGTPIIEDFYGAIDIHYFKDPKFVFFIKPFQKFRTTSNSVEQSRAEK